MLVMVSHEECEERYNLAFAGFMKVSQRLEEVTKERDTSPYWLLYACADIVRKQSCQREGDTECKHTGDCITEWCAPCAAKAWMKEQRKKAKQKPKADRLSGKGE